MATFKTAVVRAILKNGDVVEYREDITDSWNEAVALGCNPVSVEEERIEVAARNSEFEARADFHSWSGGEVI